MRKISIALCTAATLFASTADAQCFNRGMCDPSVVEVRSQMSVNVPIASPASAETALKATEDARKQLYALAGRECDTLHQIFGGDCVLSSVNMNSSMQDRGVGGSVVFVSVSNVYTVKKNVK